MYFEPTSTPLFLEAITGIRQLYKPVQPTVKQPADHVVYTELFPHLQLQPFIYCYWELKTTQLLEAPFYYRVVADGCIDIFFELNRPEETYVMGFCKKYTEFPLDHSFHYVGIRFLPAMFPLLYGVDASVLTNRFIALDTVVPAIARFISGQFYPGLQTAQMKALLDQYFLQHLTRITLHTDNRLYEAIHIILEKEGVLNIETDLDTGISPRQLRRLFEFYIGDTAKTFSKVVRFQNVLRSQPPTQSLRHNKLFFDTGYYDQAHFIRDFKNFYGVTPGKAFGR